MACLGSPETIATDGLGSYKAAMRELGNGEKQQAAHHANVHNLFNLERHLIDREYYRERRSAALVEWQMLAA
jgi:putative transposase